MRVTLTGGILALMLTLVAGIGIGYVLPHSQPSVSISGHSVSRQYVLTQCADELWSAVEQVGRGTARYTPGLPITDFAALCPYVGINTTGPGITP